MHRKATNEITDITGTLKQWYPVIRLLSAIMMNKMESKGAKRRRNIFNKFSNQLHKMVEMKLLSIELKFEKTYICPICTNQFSELNLDLEIPNHLTLEDAPPKSLGGKARTLTCHDCNNEFGRYVDFHLTEQLNELDIRSFQANTGAKAKFLHNGIQVQGTIEVDEKGIIKIRHLEKVNNPKELKKYVEQTTIDDIVDIEFPASRVDIRKFELALLKTAYIMAFEHYGYPLVLSEPFDIVRRQLQNLEDDIYPSGFWTRQSEFTEDKHGVHLITSEGFGGFEAIFVLKSQSSKSGYGVYLPLTKSSIPKVVDKLKTLGTGDVLSFESYMHNDYFEDEKNIKMCSEFMKSDN